MTPMAEKPRASRKRSCQLSDNLHRKKKEWKEVWASELVRKWILHLEGKIQKQLLINLFLEPLILLNPLKINLPNFQFIKSLRHTAILKNLNFCAHSARSKTWSRKNISRTEMKSLLTKPSNFLPFYTSSQNSNLLYSEVVSLKHS